MSQPTAANALRRKTSVGQRAREMHGLTPTRALRVALARAAGDLWELPLSVTSVAHSCVEIDALGGEVDGAALMLLLDGPEGFRGAMLVDRPLLMSVTEVQTIGAVTERPPGDRPFTPTDAALFAPLADAMLERMDVTLHGSEEDRAAFDRSEAAWALGYRFGAMVEDTHNLLLALEGEAFHLLRIDIDIAAGMRKGTMMLCLPDRPPPVVAPQEPTSGTEPGAHAEVLATVPTKLTATLPKMRMPLSRASALKPGDVLPLDPAAFQNVLLQSADGQSLARCLLGKIGDMRAVRLRPRPGEGPDLVYAEAEGGFSASYAGDEDLEDDLSDLDDLPASPGFAAPPEEELPALPPLDFGADDPGDASLPQDVGNASFE